MQALKPIVKSASTPYRLRNANSSLMVKNASILPMVKSKLVLESVMLSRIRVYKVRDVIENLNFYR